MKVCLTTAAFVLLALPALLTGSASAQDLWTDGTGSWFIAAKWSAGVPTSATDAQVTNGGTAQIFGNSAQAKSLNLGRNAGESGTLEVVSNGFLGDLTVTNFMVVGNLGSGTMRISAGASVTDQFGVIGAFGDGGGTVTVAGANASWTSTNALLMANGTLTISGGGKVSDVDGVGGADSPSRSTTTTVTGAGSTWTNTGTLRLGGYGGTDTLTIADSGSVKVTGQATIYPRAGMNIGAGAGAGTLQAGSLVNDGSLQLNHTGAATISTPLSGTGLVLKNGVGSSTITSAAGYTGAFWVNTGTLVLQNTLSAAAFFAGGTLRFDAATVNLGSSAIRAGGTVEYKNNTTVNGGFLRGSGTHTLLAGGTYTFNGVTTFNGTSITQNGSASFNNFTNGGTLTSNADTSLSFDGVTNTSSGTIVINSSLLAQDFTNNGVFVLNSGGSFDNNANDLVSGGGSRSTINSGGMLFLSDGTAWELNGALLVNNGEINGTVDVNYGSLAKGGGNFAGQVNVNDGGKFSPGNSPGSATLGAASFGAGGAYVFELNDANGSPGNGIDFIQITGRLDIMAGVTANSRFTIHITSLDASNQPGPAANFDPSHSRSFPLLTAGGGITGFTAGAITLDHSAFQNDLAGGVFSITQAGNQLVLVFTAATSTSTPTVTISPTPTPTASATITAMPTEAIGLVTPTSTPPGPPLPTVTATPSVEAASVRKCQATIAKSSAAFVQAKLAALEACRTKIVAGKLAGICPDDDSKTTQKITAALQRMRDGIAKACGGKNKVCSAADVGADADVLRTAIGFPAVCLGFEGGCSSEIAERDCGGIATCLGCIGGAAVDQAIALYYGVTPADPKAAKALNKCQRAIGKSAVKLFTAKSKVLQSCWDKVSSGKIPGPCPDAAKAEPALAKATSEVESAIATACCGKNKTCNLADGGVDADFDPITDVGFPTSCDSVTVPGRTSCDGTITDMQSLIDCVDCVTEFKVDCVDRSAVPALATYPAECNP